jgi:hypothetical protein
MRICYRVAIIRRQVKQLAAIAAERAAQAKSPRKRVPMAPSGSVALVASKAVWLMAMRIIFQCAQSFERSGRF